MVYDKNCSDCESDKKNCPCDNQDDVSGFLVERFFCFWSICAHFFCRLIGVVGIGILHVSIINSNCRDVKRDLIF